MVNYYPNCFSCSFPFYSNFNRIEGAVFHGTFNMSAYFSILRLIINTAAAHKAATANQIIMVFIFSWRVIPVRGFSPLFAVLDFNCPAAVVPCPALGLTVGVIGFDGSPGLPASSLFVTVTSQVAVLFPSFVVTVIVDLPSATAVTSPFSSTVAMLLSELDHVTDFSVALSGVMVGVSVNRSPTTASFYFYPPVLFPPLYWMKHYSLQLSYILQID